MQELFTQITETRRQRSLTVQISGSKVIRSKVQGKTHGPTECSIRTTNMVGKGLRRYPPTILVIWIKSSVIFD